MPDYPEKFIKGIPHSNYINEDGVVHPELFAFQDKHARGDGWIEESINWHDDNEAIDFTLKQIKVSGEIHFKGGVALVLTEEIERLKRRQPFAGKIDYERNKKDNNPYHGNLLVINSLLKATKRAISSHLAIVAEIIPRA